MVVWERVRPCRRDRGPCLLVRGVQMHSGAHPRARTCHAAQCMVPRRHRQGWWCRLVRLGLRLRRRGTADKIASKLRRHREHALGGADHVHCEVIGNRGCAGARKLERSPLCSHWWQIVRVAYARSWWPKPTALGPTKLGKPPCRKWPQPPAIRHVEVLFWTADDKTGGYPISPTER